MKLPVEADDYIFLDILLVFLMINYSMPLAMIYFGMVVAGSFGYLFATAYKPFKLIPISNSQGWNISKIITGIAFGAGFIFLYNQYSPTPMASVFEIGRASCRERV